MTQELLVVTESGVVLASDSLVIWEREDGRRERLSRRKLFALGRHAAIVSGGAAIGIELSRNLARLVSQSGFSDASDVLEIAPAQLSREYSAFVAQKRDWYAAHPHAPQRAYFLLAGWSLRQGVGVSLLLGSEAIDTPLSPIPIGRVVSMPRRLMLEVQLAKMASTTSLNEVADSCLKHLMILAASDPDSVGGPFDGVIITSKGLRPLLLGGSAFSGP